jgi:deoxyribodipyrimidine photolyase-related protein
MRRIRASPPAEAPSVVARPEDPARMRHWWTVLPDQLDLCHWRQVASAARSRGEPLPGVVLVESGEWLRRRPYHRQRVAIILLNLRAFAAELRGEGFDVDERRTAGTMVDALREAAALRGPMLAHEPAEREVRAELRPLVEGGALRFVPNPHWITTDVDFRAAASGRGWKMDSFYRAVRARTGILMKAGAPVGGKLSFDHDNRERWDGIPAAPDVPRFAETPLRREVEREVEERFARHPGRLDVQALPATHEDTERLWEWGTTRCLPHFGPYEDAMSERSRGLFHTRISPVLNLGRIRPQRLVDDVLASGAPLQSVEGFVRQVIGWREYVRHVHGATDGFRMLDGRPAEVRPAPGDGGYARWAGERWQPAGPAPAGVDGGAAPSHLGGERTPLPPAFWGTASGMRCLDAVVESVWDEAWSHHITRLMVLGNLATLLDVDARELGDWFWVAYMDAWDWVVEPNVLGMATYSAGGAMTTKPYVAGSAYLEKMGDFCGACAFSPGSTCPITRLYWAFLARNEPVLKGNPRMKLVMGSFRRRSEAERGRDAAAFVHVRDMLVNGKAISPDSVAAALAAADPRAAG